MAHAAPQKSARLDEPGANGMTMRKKHESAGGMLNMPQAARSLHPKCPPAQALSLKTAYTAASGMSMMNLGKYSTFKNRRWHVPLP
jgi:hypothetical protein